MTVEGLKEFGLAEMGAEEIRNFLRNQGMGVLALPGRGVPYVIPMAFGYDGGRQLYFSFFLAGESEKRDLAVDAETARFLVYSADSPFFWESVVLTGTIDEVPAGEWGDQDVAMDNAWHLDVFEQADSTGDVSLFEFVVDDQRGLKYTGLPPGLRDDGADDREDDADAGE